MANNTSSDCGCSDSLGLPVGFTGAAGSPGSISLNYAIGAAPFTNTTTTYVEAGRLIFSTTAADPFTVLRSNVWVSAGTGSMRVIDLVTSTVVYENVNLTSTSTTNIETVTGKSFYSSTGSILSVQVKHNTAGGSVINIATSLFSYS